MFNGSLTHIKVEGRKEGNALFNTQHIAPNTFYFWLYGVGHMVKDHSDSERGNPLPPLNSLVFPIRRKGTFIRTITQERIAHTMAFVVVAADFLSDYLSGPLLYV